MVYVFILELVIEIVVMVYVDNLGQLVFFFGIECEIKLCKLYGQEN